MSPVHSSPSTFGERAGHLDEGPGPLHVAPVWCLLLACVVHVGIAPPAHTWSLPSVEAPVAEPGVGDAVREALLARLAARRALDPGADALHVQVVTADWLPSRRSGDTLLYDARLVVRAQAGPRTREAWAQASIPDPGSAATPELRARVFADLADQVADELAAWVTAP